MNFDACQWPVGAETEAAKMLARDRDSRLMELDEESLSCGNLRDRLRAAAPAVLIRNDGCVFALDSANGSRAVLIQPDGRAVRISLAQLAESSASAEATAQRGEIAKLLEECGIQGRERERGMRALVAERIADIPAGKVLKVRSHPGSPFARQLAEAGFFRRLAGFALGHLLDYALTVAAWIAIGSAALGGHVDLGGLMAWALLLATIVPVRLWVAWSQGMLAVSAGGLMKQRLLAGALNLDSDALRAEGLGRMLARSLEAEALESLSLSGGLAALLAVLELGVAAAVLIRGAGGGMLGGLLAAWVAVTLGAGWIYVRRRWRGTGSRLSMTHDLVERMAGHRTRLAQEPPEEWHRGEDEALARYATDSAHMDRVAAFLTAAAPRGWMLLAFCGLLPIWVGGGLTPEAASIALGGILLADSSLRRLANGLSQLAGAGIAWREVSGLFHAAAHGIAEGREDSARGEKVLEASDLVFRHRPRGAAILKGCSLQIRRGDFVLLEGSSGSGKSTLAGVLTGLRKPESGMLLAGGLDIHSLGERGWRRRIAAAPQYHENHVLSASFAFNLLMGRGWPPEKKDTEEAAAVCRELGLGPLLDRMPAGLSQMVGETGWQLSQGERSRLFIARALLQGGSLTVLDECFAALDPENLKQALECVLRRAESLLVVAHP